MNQSWEQTYASKSDKMLSWTQSSCGSRTCAQFLAGEPYCYSMKLRQGDSLPLPLTNQARSNCAKAPITLRSRWDMGESSPVKVRFAKASACTEGAR